MQGLEPLYNHTVPFLMVLFRISGLFIFAPLLSSPMVPARVRVLLALVFTLALYPTLPPAQQQPLNLDWVSIGIAVVSESLIGLTLGLIAALPLYAVQLGGLVMGQQMGLGLANIYNPALDIEGDALGQLLLYMAIAMFVSLGGIEVCFMATARTFTNIPVASLAIGEAGRFGTGSLAFMTGMVASGFELALRIAAPVLCLILLETLATSFIMKTIPQLNILSLGFATKVLIAFLGLIISIRALGLAMNDELDTALVGLFDWAGAFNPDLVECTPNDPAPPASPARPPQPALEGP